MLTKYADAGAAFLPRRKVQYILVQDSKPSVQPSVADLLQHKLVGARLWFEHALGRRMLLIGSAQQ